MFLFGAGRLRNVERALYPTSACCPALLTFDLPAHNSIPPGGDGNNEPRLNETSLRKSAVRRGGEAPVCSRVKVFRPHFTPRVRPHALALPPCRGSTPPLAPPARFPHRAAIVYTSPPHCSASAPPSSTRFSLILHAQKDARRCRDATVGDSPGAALGRQPLITVHLQWTFKRERPPLALVCSASFTADLLFCHATFVRLEVGR